VELFSYRERLLQQGGDIRKRDGRENYMYMDMFAPPPPIEFGTVFSNLARN
jgi:hypothetical protein